MNKLKYKLTIIALSFMLLSQRQIVCASPLKIETEKTEVTVMSNSIVIKHRFYKGRSQHRRWDDDKKKWVDPRWIDD